MTPGESALISRFFIDRPIFASVLSIVITLAGGIALFALPIAQYPAISPPTVQVDCTYPGASAQVVSEVVAAPIEQQVNGVENMLYMSSQCTNDGAYNLTVTFKHGVNLNMAQVLVQNRVSLAVPMLPDVIKQTGVTTRKKAPDILLAIAITSPTGRYDQLYLSNYALLRLKDELARIPGISDVNMMAQRDYSMRIWLDPDKLSTRSITAGDVAAAIREQNMQVAAGQIGQPPVPGGQAIQVQLSTSGRLRTVEEFSNIVIKTVPDAKIDRVTRIKDVARVELGAKNQDINAQVNGKPCVSLALFQLPDANALETAEAVKKRIEELKKDFPDGVDYEIRYDTTPYISESITEVFKTLREAVLLVAIVVLLFLQNWRSALIPLVAVPVAIIGTFAVLAAFGFSLNNLTLFGLVLAIGIVVDDAIVVVEAVEHHIEHGLAPHAATVKAMDEVSGPVIAIGLVLSAVFIPCAFISGIIGQFFRQFALTIAASTIISAFNSLTLSPALAAMLLRPREKGKFEALPRLVIGLIGGWLAYVELTPFLESRLHGVLGASSLSGLALKTWLPAAAAVLLGIVAAWIVGPLLNRILAGLFGAFNAAFVFSTRGYMRVVRGMLRVSALVLVAYGGLLLLTYWRFNSTPTGFIPSQDMGYLLVNVQLPDAVSSERTRDVMRRVETIARQTPGVRHSQAQAGQSMLLSANGSNFGTMFVILEPYAKRPNPFLERTLRWLARPEMKWLFKSRWQLMWPSLSWRNGPKLVWHEGRTVNLVNGPPPVLFDGPAVEKWLRPKLEKNLGIKRQQSLSSDAIAATLRQKFVQAVPDAMLTVLGPPPVRGVGRAGGFKMMVQVRGEVGPQEKEKRGKVDPFADMELPKGPTQDVIFPALQEETENLTDSAIQQSSLVGMTSVFRANVPSLYVEVDRKECMTKEVSLKDLFDTMRIYLGSLYVNDFNLFGRTWQVAIQADERFRNKLDDVRHLRVRNSEGNMVPLGTLVQLREVNGPLVLTRYNTHPAAPINGAAAPGVSSGEAIRIMDELARRELPASSMATEWTELAFLELKAGNTAMIIFGFAVVMVFLVLAAQYESWSLPLAIIMVVPMCLLSAVSGVNVVGEDINIFTQIGFVVLVGLASKNAILIVEFAKKRREAGESRRQATLDACQLRLRPIIMTSFAFILGVVPLLLSQGAGAEMRRTLGTTVFSGMLGVTAFGIFLTPVFFYVIDWISETGVFASPTVRRVNSIVLALLTFGLISLARELSRRSRRVAPAGPTRPPAKPPAPAELSADEHALQK